MFNCEFCKVTQPSYAKPNRIIFEKRQVTYNNQGLVSRGWEIVKETNLCDDCYEEQPIRVTVN